MYKLDNKNELGSTFENEGRGEERMKSKLKERERNTADEKGKRW